MTAYVLRRILAVIPVMAVVVTIVFFLIHLIPGDPVSVMLGPDASPAQIQATRAALGLDRPLHEQLYTFYRRVLTADLGHSYFLDRPVTRALAERAEPTIVLTLCALFVAVVIGVPSGIVAAANRGSWWDRGLMFFSLLGVCVPGFWLSLNFIFLFAVRLGWLPAAGYASVFSDPRAALTYMVLPAVSLGISQSALIARIARSCMLEVLQQDYIRTARAKGLAPRVVTYVHAFRNALVPVITVIGLQVALLLSGAVLTESTFDWPGIGSKLIQYINNRDYIAVQGIITVFAIVVVAISLLVDIVNALIDPRVRY